MGYQSGGAFQRARSQAHASSCLMEGRGTSGLESFPTSTMISSRYRMGRAEDVLFEKFKTKLNNHEIPDGPVGDDTLREFKKGVEEILARPDSDSMFAVLPEEA